MGDLVLEKGHDGVGVAVYEARDGGMRRKKVERRERLGSFTEGRPKRTIALARAVVDKEFVSRDLGGDGERTGANACGVLHATVGVEVVGKLQQP